MLQPTKAEKFAARLGLPLFDVLVYITIAVLLAAIGITAAFGLTDERAKVIYLQMDERNVYELWIADPTQPENARQITRTQNGIWEYDVSADGRYVVYSMMNFNVGGREIYLLNLQTGEVTPITNCVMQDADCYAPSFRADGQMIAYERATLNTGGAVGPGAPRIWLLDLVEMETFPLIYDNEEMIIGTDAVWSSDGSHLAFYNNSGRSILVYRFADESFRIVSSGMGITGALSPGGEYLIYPEITGNRGVLYLLETATSLIRTVSNPADLADEQYAAWSADGRYVAVGRRAGDMRGTQIYLLDTWTFDLTPLLIDARYNHSSFLWNDDGTQLVMTRFQQLAEDGVSPYSEGRLEVWTYDITTRQLTRISERGLNTLRPRWIQPPRRYVTVSD